MKIGTRKNFLLYGYRNLSEVVPFLKFGDI